MKYLGGANVCAPVNFLNITGMNFHTQKLYIYFFPGVQIKMETFAMINAIFIPKTNFAHLGPLLMHENEINQTNTMHSPLHLL